MRPVTTTYFIRIVFIAMFFFSLHIALTSYVNSTFMESIGWDHIIIDTVYTLSSLLTLGAYLLIPKLIRKYGNKRMVVILLALLAFSLLGIIFIQNSNIQLILFVLLLMMNFLVIYEMDIFLEHYSHIESTGRIRGLFFMIINTAWAISPFIAGQVINSFGIRSVYFLAIAMVVVTSAIFLTHFHKIKFIQKPKRSLKEIVGSIWTNSDLRNIFTLSLTLHFFYAMAVIYVPLYLFNTIGFSWIDIGILLFFANIPFLVLGYPIGKIADQYIGEKEMMMTGLVIASIGTLGFILLNSASLLGWGIVLVVSRIGISVLETTTESYFFKKMDYDDSEVISIQRNAIPLAYLILPLIAFIINIFSDDYRILFASVIIVLLLALYPASRLQDTK